MDVRAPFVRSPYNYDMMEASIASGLHCFDPSLTVQDQKDEVDINTIVERFKITGLPPEDVRAPTSGDFTDVVDFRGAMDAIVSARESFQRMLGPVRERFGNDPARFVDFCSDPRNRAEMLKLGLLDPGKVRKDAPPVARTASRDRSGDGRVPTPPEVVKTPPGSV